MIQYIYLGRVAYDAALRLQEELVELRHEGRIDNILLLLEHPPVLTLGRNARRANVLASDELLARRGVTLHEINRGGDVTYHGPGQLVGYPIFDLRSLRNPRGGRLGPVDFVRMMEEALIRLCAFFGVRAGRIPGLTGVWCGLHEDSAAENKCLGNEETSSGAKPHNNMGRQNVRAESLTYPGPAEGPPGGRKIGAIGIHVSRGITSHGFAFNVTTDLRDFALINPCGITDRPVTSLEREIAHSESLPSVETAGVQAARQFGAVFSRQILALESIDRLRAEAEAARVARDAEFPAQDTPLEIPPEVERLHHREDRPKRA
ncbi:MAG: lipoyl(octanoyl) transferase [Terracidiphilus sp.]